MFFFRIPFTLYQKFFKFIHKKNSYEFNSVPVFRFYESLLTKLRLVNLKVFIVDKMLIKCSLAATSMLLIPFFQIFKELAFFTQCFGIVFTFSSNQYV